MKALSIQQPWAWCIAHGHKRIENRSWPTKFRGEFLIHAGLRADYSDIDFIAKLVAPTAMPVTYEKGGIIGIATLVDCVTDSADPWFFGKFGFVLENARPLPFMPVRGALGFFEVDYKA